MRVRSYKEALRLANSAGLDAAKRRMRTAGRKVMSDSDYDHAVKVVEKLLLDLGFDTAGWIALAGAPRNEPDEPKTVRKSKRRAKSEAMQLSLPLA